MEYYKFLTIAYLTFQYAAMTEQGFLLDKLVRRVSHSNSGSCSMCTRMMQDRCSTGEGSCGSTLCRKIATGTCPTELFSPKYVGDMTVKAGNPRKNEGNSVELLLVQQRPQNHQEDKHILHLMSGILTAAHTSAKADLKRAKIKEARAKID